MTAALPSPESTRMFAEARESAAVVERQLGANDDIICNITGQLRAQPPRAVLTCARGSSDHAATFAKYLIETRTGIPTSSAAPSTASVYGTIPHVADMLALAISQSGKSPDLLATMRAAREGGARTLAFVNAPDSPLAGICDWDVGLQAGVEQSIAATKSYVASLVAIAHLVARWTEDDALLKALANAPARLREGWEADWSAMVDRLANVNGLYIVGRGPGLAIAQEAALKFKETCGLHAEAFSAAELRHGPIALVRPDFPVLVFRLADAAAEGVDELVGELRERGGDVLVAGGEDASLPVAAADPVIEPMIAIQSFYRAANALAVRRGFDPDHPEHLAKVTETI